jgi:HK97 family phage prohead protease
MTATVERRTLTQPIEFRSEGTKIVASGYAAVFESRSQNLGGFVEVVKPSAFTKTLQESDVVALRNHDPAKLLGRTSAGTLRLAVDERGLHYDIDLPDTTEGRDTAVLLERGDIVGSSFGFRAIHDSWEKTADGLVQRSLDEVALRDVGPVTFPAYSEAPAALRSLAESRSLDLADLIEAAAANELRNLLEESETTEPPVGEDLGDQAEDEGRDAPTFAHDRPYAHLR